MESMGLPLFTVTLNVICLCKIKSYIVKIIRMPSISVKFLIDDMLIKIKIRTVYQYEETNPSMKSEVNGSSIKTLSLFTATLSVM